MKAKELLAQIGSGTAPKVLDVRSGLEYRRGHVEGAQHIPFWTLPARLGDVEAANHDPVVVYCGHGPRAALAASVLRAGGFQNVTLLEGHWSGWTAAGLPEVKGSGRR